LWLAHRLLKELKNVFLNRHGNKNIYYLNSICYGMLFSNYVFILTGKRRGINSKETIAAA
jgi:hypothetical protein